MIPENSPAHRIHDLPYRADSPRRNYIICSSPRTGSTLLGRVLEESGCFGAPAEYLHPRHLRHFARRLELPDADGEIDIGAYLRKLQHLRTGANSVFGLKCHYEHFGPLARARLWKRLFPNAGFIHIVRLDILRQAVSLEIAEQTKAYTSKEATLARPVFDREKVSRRINYIAETNKRWQVFFGVNGIQPYLVTYENLLLEPQRISMEIARHLNIDIGDARFELSSSGLERQSNSTNEQWVERYTTGEH